MLKEENKKLSSLMFWITSILIFLIPIFFLTITNEFFEFNKSYLFFAGTLVLILLWCIKIALEKSVYIIRSPLDLPLFLAVFSSVLSTISSLDKTSSLFGPYGKWFPSLFAILFLYLFYYTVGPVFDSAKRIRRAIYLFVVSATLVSFLALINYANATIPFLNWLNLSLLNQRGFLLSGFSGIFISLTLASSVICALLVFNLNTHLKKIAALICFFVNISALHAIGGWVFAVISMVLISLGLFIHESQQIKKSAPYLVPLFIAPLTLALLTFAIPQTKNILKREFPKETLPSTKESWVISSTTIRDYPLFGTGLGTFYLNYPRYKTPSQNNTKHWNINFDKPSNELFVILTETGLIGVLFYSVLLIYLFKIIIKNLKVNDAYKGLSIIIAWGILSIIVSFSFNYALLQNTFFLVLFTTLMAAEASINTNKRWAKLSALGVYSKTNKEDQTSIIQSTGSAFHLAPALIIIPILCFVSYQLYLQYISDYYVRSSFIKASGGDLLASYDLQAKAIQKNPHRSGYHRVYINTGLTIAQSIANSKENLTEEEKAVAQKIINQALYNAKHITENLNPYDVANWLTRAQVYKFLIPITKDADNFAIEAYNMALQLDPTNPVIRVDLGGIYYSKGDFLSAASLFKQAINLKPDYANARYNLAHAFIKLKSYEDAKYEFELVKNLVDPQSQDYQLVVKDIENLNKELESQKLTTESKPSVENLEQMNLQEKEKTPQEPLTLPQTTEDKNL